MTPRTPQTGAGREWLSRRERLELWHHSDGRRDDTLAAILRIENEARALPDPTEPEPEPLIHVEEELAGTEYGPLVKPGALPEKPPAPVIRPSSFGDWYDFGVGGAIVVAVEHRERTPVRLLLSHQLYVKTAEAIMAAYPGATGLSVLPVRGEWIAVDAGREAGA
jgi:hypothetical protein